MPSVIIMAGGVGERFWPVSRQDRPKQFLPLYANKTLLESTYARAKKIVDPNRIYIATTKQFAPKIIELIPDIPHKNIIQEPAVRNTAPCLGLSVSNIWKEQADEMIAVLPSDHMILDEDRFLREMFNAFDFLSKKEGIVTFGIAPSRPETEYGYILRSDDIIQPFPYPIYKAMKFIEKPNIDKAREYVRSGRYLWNSGMLVFKASFFMEKFKACLPNIYDDVVHTLLKTEDIETFCNTYCNFPSISISYGVMEHIEEIFVLSTSFQWNDLGNWLSFENVGDVDQYGNILINGQHINIKTHDTIVYSDEGMIATIGINDLVIAKSGNAVLVCNKKDVHCIKQLVSRLDKEGFKEYL